VGLAAGLGFAAAVGLAALPVRAAPANVGSTAFARLANSPAGHAAFDVSVDVSSVAEQWMLEGMDVVPFYYEQGMASHDGTDLVFSSRNSLTRTAVGCPAWDDPLDGACYDVGAENSAPIPAELVARGFNHVGGIDIAPIAEGPGASFVFAPLETDPPRSVRAYGVYGLASLSRAGLLVEEVVHRYNSWVAVDPTARYMIIAEDGWAPLRVYEISRAGDTIALARRADLDVTGTNPSQLPNFQGCKFNGSLTLYCSNWDKRNSYFDFRSEVYRVDLSAPIGTSGATATSALAFAFKARPKAEQLTANVPYGLETEDLAFWGGRLHIQVRGESLGWIRILHFTRN
jgi:hypothetical protein